MAVVLNSEDNSYFSVSTLRRSQSQPKFGTRQSSFRSSPSASRISETYSPAVRVYPDSEPSSAPSSPRATPAESTDLSCSSTPASNLSLASDCDGPIKFVVHPEDHFLLPSYSQAFYEPAEDLEPPTSPKTGDSYTVSPADQDTSDTTSRPGSPSTCEHAEDDTAVRAQPSRHVDYLSHNWREEDIWSSWKYIISRRGEYSNAARLENASWRTWMKAKNGLKTVSPETLNWFKDCDVTWLYGPLQTGSSSLGPDDTGSGGARLSRTNSFISKKPILKKRSMSEIMLQRSLSTSSLLKQAAAAVQAQEKDGNRRLVRPGLERAVTDYVTFPFSSRRMSRDNTSLFPSTNSSGLISPSSERKHIHFNEQVEQCIAVDIKGDDEDDEDVDTDRYGESDSDDGAIMMKRTRVRKRVPIPRKKSKGFTMVDGKTIAMLPSTTLKYREDTAPEPETAMKHSTGVLRSPAISPSSSQETLRTDVLRPSKKSVKILGADDEARDDGGDEDGAEEDSDGDEDPNPSPIWRPSPRDLPIQDQGLDLQPSASTSSLNAEPAGMRRTASGMFMPCDEGESSTSDSIFGRVIDTVNTARDIAHVIWNVGWRK